MTRRAYSTPLLVGMLALAACPGDDAPADTEGMTETEGSTTMGPTTLPMTTTVDPDTTTVDPDSTTGEPMMCEPACGAGECCVGGSCFAEPEPVCQGGCGAFEACLCPEGSDPCDCVGECVVCGIDGTYDSCLEAACPAGSVCVVDDPGAPTPMFAWCALAGCGEDDCACPLPAEGATAVPACGAFTGDDGDGSCFLDCSADGATCPDGMICRELDGQSACVWPGPDLLSDCCFPHATGGCDDATCEAAVCGADAFCCDNEWDQLCTDSVPDLCPGLCPIPPQPGYGNCGLATVACAMVETCIDDGAMAPAWAVCTEGGCGVAADCVSLAPTTGDAPVACADPSGMGGANTCYLDCAGGQTCPDGMTCVGSSFCAWPQGPVVFADDFETGDFSMGWTVNDVDGLVPAMDVDFITDAWVPLEVYAMGSYEAVSTSWYTPAGMSDDWLISPQLMLGANSRLYWVSGCLDANYPDTLEVRISTATTAIADFEANMPVFVADPEADVETFHFVDLAPLGYMNQPVYVAFRNYSFDGVLLTVDDVALVDLP